MKRPSAVTIALLSGVVGFMLAGQSGTPVPGVSRMFAAEKGQVDKLPKGMMGFRGMFAGKLVSKDEGKGTFVVKVTRILRTWEQNKAKDPKSAVGKSLKVELNPKSDRFEQFRAVLKELKVGDQVEVEAFPNEEGRLIVIEAFKKAA